MCVLDLVFLSPDEGSCMRVETLGFIKKKFSWRNVIKLKMSDYLLIVYRCSGFSKVPSEIWLCNFDEDSSFEMSH